MEPYVSIIVPVYNAEATLRRCNERIQVCPSTLIGEGILSDQFRERKLLDYYLEPVAQKNGLLLPEVRLMLQLYLSGTNTR